MYPLKFKKNYKEKVWGGRKFNDQLGMSLPNEKNFGESWEISTQLNGMSVVENGEFKNETLEDLIKTNGENILGLDIIKRFDGKFPLLVKYLDINDKLSVQVHPSDEYAKKSEGGFGKCESWYVMEASDNARLILGVKKGVTLKNIEDKVKEKDLSGIFREVSIQKGDFLDIEPGLVHASLEGQMLICEIQQNSDLTYRIWDFDRDVNGQKRDLHIKKALDVVDVNLIPNISSFKIRDRVSFENGFTEHLTKTEFYQIDRIVVSGGSFKPMISKSFVIYSILDGEGLLSYNWDQLKIVKGETYLIPANLEITIDGSLELLSSYI